jgi:Domain of unknown function (DUF3427).
VKEQRLLRMLLASMTEEKTTDSAIAALWGNDAVRTELLDLLDVLEAQVSHLQTPLTSTPDVPLQIHARYTRVEILAAFGEKGEVATPEWREGVKWLPDAKTDLLAFTIDKSVGHFSPTTRYKDYAITPSLVHWESQSRTREASETGQRYQHHAERGSSILLFARLNTKERAFWFLGSAKYVKHESEMPMAITWRLQKPMPGDLFAAFAAAVA